MRTDDAALFMAATTLDDLERIRIATENRYRTMTLPAADENGEPLTGWGLDDRHPDVAQLFATVEALRGLEHQATLQLQRTMRKHPLGPWVKQAKGVGEKQAARLLAAIGDPYWNTLHDRPRTVSELWAYCGLHVLPGHVSNDIHNAVAGDTSSTGGDVHSEFGTRDPAGVAARRRKGQRANWSTDAKTRAYLVAVSCMKSPGSPYRDVYLARREHTATTHPDWTPIHSHNDGLRIASKAILRDLWRESARLHGHIDTGMEVAA